MSSEEILVIEGADESLQAVLHHPAGEAAPMAVVLCDAGLIDKAGPYRLNVLAARELSAQGLRCLRFDFSGIGDSPARRDALTPAKQAQHELALVVDELCQRHGHTDCVVIGLCAGAFAAAQAAAVDARITGVALINPLDLAGGSDGGAFEQAVHRRRVLRRSLWSLRAWRNLVSGRVAYGRLVSSLFGKQAPAVPESLQQQRQLLEQLSQRGCHVQFFVSEHDSSVETVALITAGMETIEPNLIHDADHLFTRPEHRASLLIRLQAWCQNLAVAVGV